MTCRGKQVNSRSYFKDDLYFASVDQVYLYKRKHDTWKSIKRSLLYNAN